jgi:hypothetical protein
MAGMAAKVDFFQATTATAATTISKSYVLACVCVFGERLWSMAVVVGANFPATPTFYTFE